MSKGKQNKGNNKKQTAPIKNSHSKPNKSIINKNLKSFEVDTKNKKPFTNNQNPKTLNNGNNNIKSNISSKINDSEKKNIIQPKIIESKVVKKAVEEEEDDSDRYEVDLDASESDADESNEDINDGSEVEGSDMESMILDSDDDDDDDDDIEEIDSDGELSEEEEEEEDEDESKIVPAKQNKKEIKKVEAAKEVKKVEAAKEVKKVEAAEEVKKGEDAKEVKKVEAAKEVKKVEAAKEVNKVEAAKIVKKGEDAKEVKKVEAAKEVNKVEAAKVVKKGEDAKEVKKVEAAKEVTKVKTSKIVNELGIIPTIKSVKVVDSTTESGKVLSELNIRKNEFSTCTVFVKNISADVTIDFFKNLLKNVTTINLPTIKNKKLRGYGFFRFANNEEANEAVKVLNEISLKNKKFSAKIFSCKKVMDDIKHVDFNTVILTSFKNEDITEELKKRFNNGVIIKAVNTVTYELKFEKKGDAMSLFNEKEVTFNGIRLLSTLRYNIGAVFDNTQIPVSTKTLTVKAGMKRSKPDTKEEDIVKKAKVAENIEQTKVETLCTKISTNVEVKTAEKVIKAHIKTPENKLNNNKNKMINKKNKKSKN